MTDDEFLFSAVAELNNIAVQLIQRGLYLEAVSMLKDAIQLTKDYFCTINDSSGASDGIRVFSTIPRQRADIDQVMHAVARKRKEYINPRGLTQNEIDGQRNPINILVLSDKDSATVVHRALQRNPGTLCGITIDTDFSYMLEDGLQLMSTIVFYNYGMAFLGIAEMHRKPISESGTTSIPNIVKSRYDAMLASIKVLKLAHTLISRLIHVLDLGDEGFHSFIPCCHLIYMVLLYKLCHLSRDTSTPFLTNREIYQYYNHELKRLLAQLHNMEILYFIQRNMTSATIAPAA